MDIEAVIFDMDGTLWDSAKSVAAAWSRVVSGIEDLNITVTESKVRGVMGLPMDEIAAKLFATGDEALDNEIMNRCGDYENVYLRRHGGVLYDGLEETLAALAKKYKLFIVSNCQSGYIEAFLDYYGFARYFTDFTCWGDNKVSKDGNIKLICERNGVAAKAAVYVGDTQGDCVSAYRAGTRFAFAAYGFGEADRYDIILNSITDLINVL